MPSRPQNGWASMCRQSQTPSKPAPNRWAFSFPLSNTPSVKKLSLTQMFNCLLFHRHDITVRKFDLKIVPSKEDTGTTLAMDCRIPYPLCLTSLWDKKGKETLSHRCHNTTLPSLPTRHKKGLRQSQHKTPETKSF